MKITEAIEKRLSSINLWHFIWMSVVTSEVLTSIMSLILRGRITYDYLITGSVVSLIVAGVVIVLVQNLRRIEERTKRALEEANDELENRVAQRTAELQASNELLNEEITERKQAQTLAEAANKAKSQFLAAMSHELRTPLNHIIGFNQLVLDRNFGPLTATQEEYLGDSQQSSYHLLSLINDILDISKVEAGKLELTLAPADLPELLLKSLTMVQERASQHSISVSLECGTLPREATVDERKIRQIVYNLLSNAVKFTPDGGAVSVSGRTDKSGGAEISVTDTGVGIEPDHLERVFRPFEQLDNAIRGKQEGTGLGLSLTRRLVELHNGTLRAESSGLGQGSTFTFTIPCRPGQE